MYHSIWNSPNSVEKIECGG